MAWQQTCDELIEQVKAKGPRSLSGRGNAWLDEIVDIDGAAEFTGLSTAAVRHYHSTARRLRANEGKCLRCRELTDDCQCPEGPRLRDQSGNQAKRPVWLWPEPDMILAGHAGWKLRTIVLSRASMPGRGAGGGRPWPKPEPAKPPTRRSRSKSSAAS